MSEIMIRVPATRDEQRKVRADADKAGLSVPNHIRKRIGLQPRKDTRGGARPRSGPPLYGSTDLELTTMRLIRERRECDLTHAEIADSLNRDGLSQRRGGEWTVQAVARILAQMETDE